MSLPPLPTCATYSHGWKLYGADQMHAYAAAARLAALEEAARMLDREHEARKHIDNHAAFYARKIRELAIHVPPTCTENREK